MSVWATTRLAGISINNAAVGEKTTRDDSETVPRLVCCTSGRGRGGFEPCSATVQAARPWHRGWASDVDGGQMVGQMAQKSEPGVGGGCATLSPGRKRDYCGCRAAAGAAC
jgi:hypothetical protein